MNKSRVVIFFVLYEGVKVFRATTSSCTLIVFANVFFYMLPFLREFSMSPFNLFLLLFAQCKTVKQTNESFSYKKQSRIKTMLFNSFRTLHKASRSLTESTLLQKILSFSFIGIQKGYPTKHPVF